MIKQKFNKSKKIRAMSTYFPYSHIILNICNNISETITKHAYFGEWSVCEQTRPVPQTGLSTISEIYY